eukprot:3741417-Pyramimonas_sp.AAC.1
MEGGKDTDYTHTTAHCLHMHTYQTPTSAVFLPQQPHPPVGCSLWKHGSIRAGNPRRVPCMGPSHARPRRNPEGVQRGCVPTMTSPSQGPEGVQRGCRGGPEG